MKICLDPAQYRLMYSLQVRPVVCGVNLNNSASYTMTKQLSTSLQYHQTIQHTLYAERPRPTKKDAIRFRVEIRSVPT